MVAYFLGGAALSALTSSLYASDGWSGVCILGAATALLALLVWALHRAVRPPRRRAVPRLPRVAGAAD